MNTKSQKINETIKIIKTRKQKLFNGARPVKSRKAGILLEPVISNQQAKNPEDSRTNTGSFAPLKMTKEKTLLRMTGGREG